MVWDGKVVGEENRTVLSMLMDYRSHDARVSYASEEKS